MLRFGFLLLTLVLAASAKQVSVVHFDEPVDALSIGFHTDTPDLSVLQNGRFERLVIEKEFDPLLRESNLVMFPEPIKKVVLRGSTHDFDLHPIRVSTAPAAYVVAATQNIGAPRILSRKEWSADESFLLEGKSTSRSDEPQEITATDTVSTPSQRVLDCEEAQKLYPDEFKTSNAITSNANGDRYRWPQRYSNDVKLLVVHHTAIRVSGDPRPGIEKVRALYSYHANNRGWGDIGYNFVIDETGQIYEGRAGGDYVVAGHAYCYNVGTIGIALLGNFDEEQPQQAQIKSLQWLLHDLSDRYGIDPSKSTTFHGKTLQPIVRHKDLLSTDCPGYYVSGVIAQIRSNVIAGTVDKPVNLPMITVKSPVDRTTERLNERLSKLPTTDSRRLSRISRQVRTAQRLAPTSGRQTMLESAKNGPADPRSKKEEPGRPVRGLITASNNQQLTINNQPSPTIRVRLTYDQSIATVSGRGGLSINGITVDGVRLGKDGSNCVAIESGSNPPRTIAEGTVRMQPLTGIFTIDSKVAPFNRYTGLLECGVVDGKLTLINELSLEDYLAGLSEEPDTEPAEKQKAFAIAARTYAAYYLDPKQRKFPGMPFDGDDSPARFQAYSGVTFAERNPKWTEAVQQTSGIVIVKNGKTIKAPYFSSDDGRTRTPKDNGWSNFPFEEVFTAKPDPWCKGMPLAGHGVGMSGCGAEGQANEGKSYTDILKYYYPGTEFETLQ